LNSHEIFDKYMYLPTNSSILKQPQFILVVDNIIKPCF
jgi:hypothetical protein